MLVDAMTGEYEPRQSLYPTRHPKLGVSAVLRSKSIAPSPQTTNTCDNPLRTDEPTPLTCRFRPGLRPVRIIDMAHFRLKRKQLNKNTLSDENKKDTSAPVSRWSTLAIPSKRQPLKAFQQNTLPSANQSFHRKGESTTMYSTDTGSPSLSKSTTRFHRISTNPKIRRYSSSEVPNNSTFAVKCTDESLSDQGFIETEASKCRKRRSVPTRPSKKQRPRDSLESVKSSAASMKSNTSMSVSTTSTTPSLSTNSATTATVAETQRPTAGVMTRIRSQTQLAYEAVKRVVRRHSRRGSGSYELRCGAHAEIF